MFSFAQPGVRQFGGVGAMVGQGTLRLRIEPAERFAAEGPLAERVWRPPSGSRRFAGDAELPACRVEVIAAPRQHVGLGVGTQLALSVCAGLNAFLGGEPLDAAALALLSGRSHARPSAAMALRWADCWWSRESLPTNSSRRWSVGSNCPASGGSS